MKTQFSIPLFFFLVASCIGLLLRWHFVSPLEWLEFPYWLHAHSHMMFLGWIFNVLLLAYIWHFDLYKAKRYRYLFFFVQVLLIGMLVSFPLQGYGPVSISLSALHTLAIWICTYWFFRDTGMLPETASHWFAKRSLILFAVSSAGVLAVGPIAANGLAQTKWYYFAVYYYLHFQYNGVFVFGVLSLFLKLMEDRDYLQNHAKVKRAGRILFISLFPGYFLSVLWADPGWFFNVLGLTGALLQLLFVFYFIVLMRRITPRIERAAKVLMMISLVSFGLKALLQLLSAHPSIARLAYETRPFIIAYLHLVLVGTITFFLIAWYIEQGWVKLRSGVCLSLVLSGFGGMELAMLGGSLPFLKKLLFTDTNLLTGFFSLLLVIGIVFFIWGFFAPKSR